MAKKRKQKIGTLGARKLSKKIRRAEMDAK